MHDLIVGTHPIFLTPPKKFDFTDPVMNPEDLSLLLMNKINEHDALGLSATQLGINCQVLAVKGSPFYVMFNPKIVHFSTEIASATEGCLSFPGLYVKIQRPYSIRVRFQTPSGATTTKNFEAGASRIIQHEMDHMNGELFWNKANFFNKNKAQKDWKAIERKINKFKAALPA